MKNLIIASTSTVYGGEYLDYLTKEMAALFKDTEEVIFIPYARPGGITHDEYTEKHSDGGGMPWHVLRRYSCAGTGDVAYESQFHSARDDSEHFGRRGSKCRARYGDDFRRCDQ